MQVLYMRKSLAALAALGALSTISVNLKAQRNSSPVLADNSKVNQRDRSTTAPTADQGKNDQTDREITQKIRKSLMGDKSLSTFGKSVKIIAQKGQVTLEGLVASEEESREVEEKATEVAGSGNVSNDMNIKSARTRKIKPTS
jgi:osmotically-inducible protein OsmY